MAYNEKLAERIKLALCHLPVVEEKKMFGSQAFMVNNKIGITAGADRIMCLVDRNVALIYSADLRRKVLIELPNAPVSDTTEAEQQVVAGQIKNKKLSK